MARALSPAISWSCLLPQLRIHVRREQLAPRAAQLLNPVRIFRAELLLELDANALRERRAVARGRDRDLQVAAS